MSTKKNSKPRHAKRRAGVTESGRLSAPAEWRTLEEMASVLSRNDAVRGALPEEDRERRCAELHKAWTTGLDVAVAALIPPGIARSCVDLHAAWSAGLIDISGILDNGAERMIFSAINSLDYEIEPIGRVPLLDATASDGAEAETANWGFVVRSKRSYAANEVRDRSRPAVDHWMAAPLRIAMVSHLERKNLKPTRETAYHRVVADARAAFAPNYNRASDPGGRPEQYDWDVAVDLLVDLLIRHGLPETKNELIERFVQFVPTGRGQREPSMEAARAALKRKLPTIYHLCQKEI